MGKIIKKSRSGLSFKQKYIYHNAINKLILRAYGICGQVWAFVKLLPGRENRLKDDERGYLMFGIVGAVGHKQCSDVLLDALKRLE